MFLHRYHDLQHKDAVFAFDGALPVVLSTAARMLDRPKPWNRASSLVVLPLASASGRALFSTAMTSISWMRRAFTETDAAGKRRVFRWLRWRYRWRCRRWC